VLFFCSFCLSFWPLPMPLPTIYIVLHLLPAFVLSFAGPLTLGLFLRSGGRIALHLREVCDEEADSGCVVVADCIVCLIAGQCHLQSSRRIWKMPREGRKEGGKLVCSGWLWVAAHHSCRMQIRFLFLFLFLYYFIIWSKSRRGLRIHDG